MSRTVTMHDLEELRKELEADEITVRVDKEYYEFTFRWSEHAYRCLFSKEAMSLGMMPLEHAKALAGNAWKVLKQQLAEVENAELGSVSENI
jgi:hypothetical protein